MKGYPSWFTARFVTIIIMMLFVSGLLLIPTTLDLRFEWDLIWRLSDKSRIIVVAVHVLVAFFVLYLLGALWSIHMRSEWRKGNNKLTGILLNCLMASLVVSGIAIYYVGDESMALLSSSAHIILGLILGLLYLAHINFN